VVHESDRPVSIDTLMHLCLGVGERESYDAAYLQGRVSVRSVRSPDKETPNEDAAALIPVGDTALVLAVADGVGGNPGGHEASKLAIKTLQEQVATIEDIAQLRNTILDAVDAANREVIGLNRGAATTLAIAEIVGTRLRCYHVGDSELISVGQRGRVKLRVVPHSPTGFAVEAGLMDEQEAVRHDQRHVLFNVIGSPDMRIDIGATSTLAMHDTLLLATDGLMDNLFVNEIVDIIRAGPLATAADRLVDRARERMTNGQGDGPSKPDDLTVILYRAHNGRRKR
jgi:serine/threonine protein phosphatase PrpC